MDDGALMDRFERNARRFSARDAILTVVVTGILLVVLQGAGMTAAGERLEPGIQRDIVLAVGKPAGWVSDRLGLHEPTERLTASLSPDTQLAQAGGFQTATRGGGEGEVPLVTPDAFAPSAIGAPAAKKRPLKTLLVTGDSLSTPLDLELGRKLAGRGVRVERDPHLGTGLSKTDLLDWGKLSETHVAEHKPDAVVVFIGANEGFAMPAPSGKEVTCCSAEWAAIYANRARQVMNNYRRKGEGRVFWITVPAPRDADRHKIVRVVNTAIDVAAQPWRAQVRVLDTTPIFTPGGKYRDAMPVAGRDTVVRESDGVHLNRVGSSVLADSVIGALGKDFGF